MGFLKGKNPPPEPVRPESPAEIRMQPMEEENLLDRVAWAARAVHKLLGPGFEREIYLNAMAAELQRQGMLFERDKEFAVTYHGMPVGSFVVDILVEGRLLARIGNAARLEECDVAAMESYLAQARLSHGLLVEFGGPRIQLVRFEPRD